MLKLLMIDPWNLKVIAKDKHRICEITKNIRAQCESAQSPGSLNQDE